MTSCIDHAQCDPGFKISLSATAFRNRGCTSCNNGTTFQLKSNQDECIDCRKCDVPNKYNETCIVTRDSTCLVPDLGESGGSGLQSRDRGGLSSSLKVCNNTQYNQTQRNQCFCDVVESIGNTAWSLIGDDKIWASCSVVCDS